MMCFYGAYFAYLITGFYYYYEKIGTRTLFALENFVELHWMLFTSLGQFCIIATSVNLKREVSVI